MPQMIGELYDWLLNGDDEDSQPLLPMFASASTNPTPLPTAPASSGAHLPSTDRRHGNALSDRPLSPTSRPLPQLPATTAPPLLQPTPRYHETHGAPIFDFDMFEAPPASGSLQREDPPVPRISYTSSTGTRRLETPLNCPTYRRLAARLMFWSHLPFDDQHRSSAAATSRWFRSLLLWPTFEVTSSELTEFLSTAVDTVVDLQIEDDVATVIFQNATGVAATNICGFPTWRCRLTTVEEILHLQAKPLIEGELSDSEEETSDSDSSDSESEG